MASAAPEVVHMGHVLDVQAVSNCHIALCFVSDYHIWKPVLTQNVMLTQNLFGFLCRAPKLRKFRNTKKGTY